MSFRNKNPRKKGTAPRSHSLPPHANNEEWNCKLCEKPDSADNLVQCDLCEHWYHWSCVGVTADIEFQEYICEKCKSITKTNSSNLAHTQHENQSPNKLQNASNTASVVQSTPENIGTNTSNQESSPTTLQSALQPNSMPQSTTAIHENQTHSSATSVPLLESILETPISTNKAVAPNTITWKDVAKIRKTYQLCTPERQDNPQGQLNHNKASSCKSSVSASTSKKISLKLKQLEEEHALRERREKDYLDRKYRIYEEMADGVSENSDDQSVISVEKINRWLECVDLGQQEYPSTSNRHNKTGCNDIKNKDIPTKVNIDNFIDLPNAVNATDQVASRIGHQNLSTIKGNTLLSAEQIAARQVMPKDLPVFTGKPEEWPLFMNALENSSRICGFNDDENLIRLQRCLKGKALEAVRFRLMYPQQVPSVIDTLRMLFGKPDKIISSLLSQVRSEPAPKADKLDTLITFALAVQNICAIMEANHLQNHINNPCLLQELVDKLPPMLKLNWSIHKQGLGDVNLTHFSSWLFNLAQAASDLQDSANTDKKSLANCKQKAFLNIHEQHGSNKVNGKICKGSCRTFADCKLLR